MSDRNAGSIPAGGDPEESAWALLGARTVVAAALATAYAAATALQAGWVMAAGGNWVLGSTALLLYLVSAAVLMRVRGDPLPTGPAIFLVVAGPIACVLQMAQTAAPIVTGMQTWPVGTFAFIYTFLCVRGRTVLAWVGLGMMLLVMMVWSVGAGAGF